MPPKGSKRNTGAAGRPPVAPRATRSKRGRGAGAPIADLQDLPTIGEDEAAAPDDGSTVLNLKLQRMDKMGRCACMRWVGVLPRLRCFPIGGIALSCTERWIWQSQQTVDAASLLSCMQQSWMHARTEDGFFSTALFPLTPQRARTRPMKVRSHYDLHMLKIMAGVHPWPNAFEGKGRVVCNRRHHHQRPTI